MSKNSIRIGSVRDSLGLLRARPMCKNKNKKLGHLTFCIGPILIGFVFDENCVDNSH